MTTTHLGKFHKFSRPYVSVYTDASVDVKRRLGAIAVLMKFSQKTKVETVQLCLPLPSKYCDSSNIAELYAIYYTYKMLEQTGMISRIERVDMYVDNVSAIKRAYGVRVRDDYGELSNLVNLIANFFATVGKNLIVGIQKVDHNSESIHGINHQVVHDLAILRLRQLRENQRR